MSALASYFTHPGITHRKVVTVGQPMSTDISVLPAIVRAYELRVNDEFEKLGTRYKVVRKTDRIVTISIGCKAHSTYLEIGSKSQERIILLNRRHQP